MDPFSSHESRVCRKVQPFQMRRWMWVSVSHSAEIACKPQTWLFEKTLDHLLIELGTRLALREVWNELRQVCFGRRRPLVHHSMSYVGEDCKKKEAILIVQFEWPEKENAW